MKISANRIEFSKRQPIEIRIDKAVHLTKQTKSGTAIHLTTVILEERKKQMKKKKENLSQSVILQVK